MFRFRTRKVFKEKIRKVLKKKDFYEGKNQSDDARCRVEPHGRRAGRYIYP